jgi:5-hydroxyisourate hydrolase
MSLITTHVLDTSAGCPAAGIAVVLEFFLEAGATWNVLAHAATGPDGRVRDWLPGNHALEPGLYCLRFDTSRLSPFFPEVSIRFRVDDPSRHYHVPLLLSPYGYSTYRGS